MNANNSTIGMHQFNINVKRVNIKGSQMVIVKEKRNKICEIDAEQNDTDEQVIKKIVKHLHNKWW